MRTPPETDHGGAGRRARGDEPMSSRRPRSLADALALLAGSPPPLPVAGCTDLLVTSALERAAMRHVVDLLSVRELRGIEHTARGWSIGATTTFAGIRESGDIRAAYPSLAEAASVVGGWQIQNRATLAGNVANASPAGDSLPVLLALGATIVAAGAGGSREIPYDRFHTGYRTTALRPGEIITRVVLPVPGEGSVQRFRKVGTRRAQAISKVVVALSARVHGGEIREVRLAAGSVGPVPLRLVATERLLEGARLTRELAMEAGRTAVSEVTPITDVRSTADYRRHALERVVTGMVRSLAQR